MQTQRDSSPHPAVRWLVVPAVLIAAALAAYLGHLRIDAVAETSDPVSTVEDGDVVYVFDAISGQESLFDRKADPRQRRNLAPARLGDVERLRKQLLRSRRVGTLEELRDVHRDQIERLRALGYL